MKTPTGETSTNGGRRSRAGRRFAVGLAVALAACGSVAPIVSAHGGAHASQTVHWEPLAFLLLGAQLLAGSVYAGRVGWTDRRAFVVAGACAGAVLLAVGGLGLL
ncbi:hypothetical protein [Halegenticoccus tardaugens]|uniref:hypothetical protein n=1 Tax=Halegenticoccus tardaugens TaxID=2071624 RepID=UPI00100B2BFE|nr:hypothetical protein [Halegenticoccus tardaugens]